MYPLLASALGGMAGVLVVTGAIGAWRRVRGLPSPAGKDRGRLGLVASIGAVIGAQAGHLANHPSVENQLDRANPEFAVLHRYYPTEYRQIVEAVRRSGGGPNALLTVQQVAVPMIGRLMASHASQINDQNSRALFGVLADDAQALRTRAPDACVNLMAGKAPGVDLTTMLTTAQVANESTVTGEVLKQVATQPARPAQPLSADETRKIALQAFSQLPAAEQVTVRPIAQSPTLAVTPEQKTAYCDFMIQTFKVGLAGSPDTTRRLMAAPAG